MNSPSTASQNAHESANAAAAAQRRRLRLLILVVAYEAEATIEAVLRRIPKQLGALCDAEILVIDDASRDRTFALARAVRGAGSEFPLHVLVNPQNQGYGGNQKLGFHFALDRDFDAVALLHGDAQYAPECLPALLAPLAAGETDAVLGSRMLTRRGALRGGMPLYKYVGNRVLTALQNRLFGTQLSEYHSGYRLYTADALRRIPFDLNSNGFPFDTEIILQLLIAGQRLRELPIPTHYGDEISRVQVVRYGSQVLRSTLLARLQQLGLHYDRRFDCGRGSPTAPGSAQQGCEATQRQALALLAPGSRVLLIGRAERWAAALRARGCAVSAACPEAGGALDALAASAPLDAPVLPESLTDYDAVLLDGVDRLRSPEAFVDRLREAARLAPQLTVLVSCGNVGFVLTRLLLLFGQFNYSGAGIPDASHTRLFTLSALRRLLEQGGFQVRTLCGVPLPFPSLLGDVGAARGLLRANRALLRLSRSLFAYRLVAVARPRLSLEYLLTQTEAHSLQRSAALATDPAAHGGEAPA